MDNRYILALEIVHTFAKKQGWVGLMGIKLDMWKVQDVAEWKFLIRILELFGFSEVLVN